MSKQENTDQVIVGFGTPVMTHWNWAFWFCMAWTLPRGLTISGG